MFSYPENRGRKRLRNSGTYIPIYSEKYPRTLVVSTSTTEWTSYLSKCQNYKNIFPLSCYLILDPVIFINENGYVLGTSSYFLNTVYFCDSSRIKTRCPKFYDCRTTKLLSILLHLRFQTPYNLSKVSTTTIYTFSLPSSWSNKWSASPSWFYPSAGLFKKVVRRSYRSTV